MSDAPHRLPQHLREMLLPEPPPSYRDKIDAIIMDYRVRHQEIRRQFQDDFYDLAKAIGRIRWHDVITGGKASDH